MSHTFTKYEAKEQREGSIPTGLPGYVTKFDFSGTGEYIVAAYLGDC